MLFVGDEVNAQVLGINKRSRIEAKIMSIVSRSQKTITGYYDQRFDGHFLKPISKNNRVVVTLLPPPIKLEPEALIEAEIIIQPSESAPAVAKFTKKFEQVSPVKEAMMIASKKYDLIEEWSKKATTYVEDISDEVIVGERVDLRKMSFVTIDGADAKD